MYIYRLYSLLTSQLPASSSPLPASNARYVSLCSDPWRKILRPQDPPSGRFFAGHPLRHPAEVSGRDTLYGPGVCKLSRKGWLKAGAHPHPSAAWGAFPAAPALSPSQQGLDQRPGQGRAPGAARTSLAIKAVCGSHSVPEPCFSVCLLFLAQAVLQVCSCYSHSSAPFPSKGSGLRKRFSCCLLFHGPCAGNGGCAIWSGVQRKMFRVKLVVPGQGL